METEELKKHSFHGKLGCAKPTIDTRDYQMSFETVDTTIPEIYSSELPRKIKDQGEVSSCVAHGISETIEHLNVLDTDTYIEFSTGFIYGNKDDKNSEGMIIRDALKFVNNTGDVFESDFPYNFEIPDIFAKINEIGNDKLISLANQHKKIITYFQLNSDNDIKHAIMKYGYVITGIKWYEENSLDYKEFSSKPGDFSYVITKGQTYKGNHCIIIYGWDKDNWKIANSWGELWGNGGCALLPYTYGLDEAWGVEGNTLEKQQYIPTPSPVPTPVIKKKSDNEFFQTLWKIINVIINWFIKK